MKRLLLVIFAAFLLLPSCKKSSVKKVQFFPNIDKAPNIQITNMTSYYKSDSRLRAKIVAPEADYYFNNNMNPHMDFPKGFTAIFYDQNFKPISQLHSDYAVYYQRLGLWKLTGNVVVKNKSGSVLRTQELFYDENKEQIFSIKFVEVTDTSGSILRGKGGFVSDINFKNYEFKNVDGIIRRYKTML